jgi:hypothetical protein
MKCKNNLNPYVYSTISALIGTAVYIITKYLLVKQFDIIPTILIVIALWFGNFIAYRISRKKK